MLWYYQPEKANIKKDLMAGILTFLLVYAIIFRLSVVNLT